jgi:hypothetical protein
MTETRSTHPIAIIAKAIHDGSCDCGTVRYLGEADAKAAAKALTDDAIVANAVRALLDDGWCHTHEGQDGVGELSDEDLANIARTVLGSVAGD